MIDQLHREHFHLMVSIWPFFYPGTATYDDMDKRGYFIEKAPAPSFHPKGMALYDRPPRKYFARPQGGHRFRRAVRERISAADHDGHLRTSAAGERSETSVHSFAVCLGGRSEKYGVTAWSGDVLSDFETFKRLIPAGLNFSMSGLAYWTTDIGGFILGHPNDPRYRELFIRWFQYGTFCQIFRVHGTRAKRK